MSTLVSCAGALLYIVRQKCLNKLCQGQPCCDCGVADSKAFQNVNCYDPGGKGFWVWWHSTPTPPVSSLGALLYVDPPKKGTPKVSCDLGFRLRYTVFVFFNGCFLVIEARGGTWFRTPCPYSTVVLVVRSRSKVVINRFIGLVRCLAAVSVYRCLAGVRQRTNGEAVYPT